MPHECSKCGHAYSTVSYRDGHERTCTGVNIHRRTCARCNREFTRPASRKRHEATCRVGDAPAVLRNFGDERTDHIAPEVWDECLRLTATGVRGAVRIAEELRRHPENDNADLRNLAYPIMFRVYQNNAWTLVDKDTFMATRLGVAVAALCRYYAQSDMVAEDESSEKPIAKQIIELSKEKSRSFNAACRAVYASFVATYECRLPRGAI